MACSYTFIGGGVAVFISVYFGALMCSHKLREYSFAKMYSAMAGNLHKKLEKIEDDLLSNLKGTIIEIGSGPGAGVRYFKNCDHVTFVEPNSNFLDPLRKAISDGSIKSYKLVNGTLADLVADNANHGQADAIVCLLVLCSVPDVKLALEQIHVLLKPGGRFYMLEHVKAPSGTVVCKLQEVVEPAWKIIGGGCHLTRIPHVTAMAQSNKWEMDNMDNFQISTPLPCIKDMVSVVLKKK